MSNTQSWAPYARDILRRLRHAQTVVTNDLFDEAKQIVPVEDPPARNLLEALSELEGAQTRDSQELAELREAGTDGWAMDENGNDRPKQRKRKATPTQKQRHFCSHGASHHRAGGYRPSRGGVRGDVACDATRQQWRVQVRCTVSGAGGGGCI